MIVYIDHAFMRRLRVGKIRDLNDIIHAHTEGTVLRVRPKLMTVGTMLIGLVPLLWATGSGADVMKRIAAPMVGGLLSSAFLTLADPGRLHVLALRTVETVDRDGKTARGSLWGRARVSDVRSRFILSCPSSVCR